jgi:hypothetical protein
MAKGRTNRRTKSKSKTRSRSRSRRGGAQVFGGGAPWAPAASNMHRDLTAPSAVGNHFKLSPHGVHSGGGQPPVPAMSGPGAGQINRLSPPLGFKGGFRGKSRGRGRNRKGGGGGLFQLAQTAWDSAANSVGNIVKGYNGYSQSPPPWPWIQRELTKPPNIPIAKPVDLNPFKITAAKRAANV